METELVKHFPRNEQGRDFVVGDLHGEFTKLETALKRLRFDETRDRLFSVGDLVNLGTYSERVTEWLDRPWFHPVMGDHEERVVSAQLKHTDSNGDQEMEGFRWWSKASEELRTACAERMARLPVAIEVETEEGLVGIVHAQIPQASKWGDFVKKLKAGNEAVCRQALWGGDPLAGRQRVTDLRQLFCGHTIVAAPTRVGNVRYIDTGAYEGGALTVVPIL